MRVMMIAPQPFFEPRGTPFSIYGRIRALTEIGHSVVLYTYHLGENINLNGLIIKRIPRVPFIKKIKIGPSFTKIILDILLFFKVLMALIKEKPDIIHTHEEACYMGAVLKKIFKIPHIYDMHSSLPQQIVNYRFFPYKWLINLLKKLEKWAILYSDGVITICQDLNRLAEEIVKSSNTNINPVINLIENMPPPEIQKMEEGKINLKEKHNIVNGEIVFVYTGNLEKNQGIELLMSSIPLIEKMTKKPFKFLIVGGKEEQINHMALLLDKSGGRERVIFIGQKKPEEVQAYLEIADVLVSPRCEGTNVPLKIYSYLFSGKAILATNLLAHSQILNDDISLMVEPTPQGISEGAVRLIEDEVFRRKLGEKAREFALKNYNWKIFLQRTDEFYNQIYNKKN